MAIVYVLRNKDGEMWAKLIQRTVDGLLSTVDGKWRPYTSASANGTTTTRCFELASDYVLYVKLFDMKMYFWVGILFETFENG